MWSGILYAYVVWHKVRLYELYWKVYLICMLNYMTLVWLCKVYLTFATHKVHIEVISDQGLWKWVISNCAVYMTVMWIVLHGIWWILQCYILVNLSMIMLLAMMCVYIYIYIYEWLTVMEIYDINVMIWLAWCSFERLT